MLAGEATESQESDSWCEAYEREIGQRKNIQKYQQLNPVSG